MMADEGERKPDLQLELIVRDQQGDESRASGPPTLAPLDILVSSLGRSKSQAFADTALEVIACPTSGRSQLRFASCAGGEVCTPWQDAVTGAQALHSCPHQCYTHAWFACPGSCPLRKI